MADIVLSKGIRTNLLQLQNTAANVALTQNRLATGKKVNTALDNPTNFFTAAALNSRANDLSALLDGLSNGIKVIEAADNGLTAITKTIESLQSTVRQARQDKTFKTSSYSLDAATVGTSSVKYLGLSGGAVGSTPVNIALNTLGTAAVQNTIVGSAAYTAPTAAVQSTVVGSAAYTAPTAATAGTAQSANFASVTLDDAGDSISFDIAVDGGAATTVTLTKSQINAIGDNDDVVDDITEYQSLVQAGLTAAGVSGVTVSNDGSKLTFTSNTTGASSAVAITNATQTNGGGADTIAATGGIQNTAGTAGAAAVDRVITISDGTNTANITLTSANAANAATAASYINTQLTSAGITGTVTNNAGTLTVAGAADGSNSLTVGGADANAVFGAGRTTTAGAAAVDRVISISDGTRVANITLTSANAANAGAAATYINAQLSSAGITGTVTNNAGTLTLAGAAAGTNNLTISGAGATSVFGASPTTTAGAAAVSAKVYSVEELVNTINANTSLTGKIRASNDAGKIRIENMSTSDLTLAGIGATSGQVDGSAGTATISFNEVRKNLVTQFNDLRNQLDKLADDSSFNGINLLRGDVLKLFLNENSTSTIEIQAKDLNGNVREISNTKLGITAATKEEFENDSALDARLDGLKASLDTIRSQASSFGSNLSIVENRQNFTKQMMNTLKGGADNLTLADANEEAANLLALQTRQQLSQTALSLANQADQGVLRLFG